jgi:transcription elongation GreA/GreB family factor
MSQAFVKESDASDDLPERPLSEEPNYVTPRGQADLREQVSALREHRAALLAQKTPETEAALKAAERDLRYFQARLETAIVVEHKDTVPADVRFGAEVEVQADGALKRFAIVGEDEAAPESGKLAWCSPMARALLGAKPGDAVDFGEKRLQVLSVRY